ncbi:unnamed protein product [Peniophora sp. CBMAI 1063]|nr:unnamed protein product [Peniophora sp. CBMAI 1063]
MMTTIAPATVLIALGLAACAVSLLMWKRRARSQEDRTRQRKIDPGFAEEWAPVSFQYPEIAAFEHDVDHFPPRPYRPFKPGTYHVTMGIRNMNWNDWIELDSQFLEWHRIRSERITARGSQLIHVLPDRPIVRGAQPAAEELVQELSEFLVRRYPSMYSVTRDESVDGWNGAGKVTTVTILPTKETYDVSVEPMRVAALLIPDDLAILIKGQDGQYYLQGGAIIVPGTWRLKDKIGMPLDEIHITGEVPYYKEKLQLSMNRFFSRLPVDKPVVRNNWFFQAVLPRDVADPHDPEELGWYKSVMGSEDDFVHVPSSYLLEMEALAKEKTGKQHPAQAYDAEKPQATTTKQQKCKAGADNETPSPVLPITVDRIRLRSERQTLRRLPRTGAIVFTVRTYKTPLEQLAREPGMAARLAAALQGVKEGAPETYSRMLSMKGLEKVLLDYLDARATLEGAL